MELFNLNILQILIILWFIKNVKIIAFYIYLWQLKEYHIGRFLDHFHTEKGQSLILNGLVNLKLILVIYFFYFPYILSSLDYLSFLSPFYSTISIAIIYLLPVLLSLIYFFESLKTLADFFRRRIKLPVLTKKILFLAVCLLILEILVIFVLLYFVKELNFFTFWLLIFDIFAPLFISTAILILQPLTVVLRGLIILRAKRKRQNFKDLSVIGITGSYGKTSTKEFLYTILSQKFKVLKTKEHQNSEAGISFCILNELKPEHEVFIVEMGAYGRGGIKLLCDIAKPKIGILTGINEQHLSLFGSQENIIKAKYELIEALPDDGLAIFNGDNKYCLDLYLKTEKPKKLFVSNPREFNFGLDIWAENIIVQKDYVFFKVCTEDSCQNYKAYLSGAHFVPNLFAAICVAKELGMEDTEIAEACLKIKPPKNTMKIYKGIKDLIIIEDTYSANPEGVIAALNYLKIYGGKKMIILPSLIELGKTSKQVHRRIGEKIGEVCEAVIVTTQDYFQEIGQGFLKKGGKEENVLFTDNPKEILEIIQKFWNHGDVILLEGRVPNQLISSLIINY